MSMPQQRLEHGCANLRELVGPPITDRFCLRLSGAIRFAIAPYELGDVG
jgi:hypothetical protein